MSKSKTKPTAKPDIEPKLRKVKSEEFFVVHKNLADALMVYLQDKPYKETAQLVPALGNSKILKNFLEENIVVD